MYSVIDIGSNTIRLSVYKKREKTISLIFNKKTMAGLVGYVNKKGYMSPRGIQVAIDTINSYKQILENIKISNVYVFATASLRNIKNTTEAVTAIEEATGYTIDVVSGELEGRYAFIGATCLLPLDQGMVVDIGGGSTEVVAYDKGEIVKSISLPIGSLNLYNKHVKKILPSSSELEDIRKDVKDILKTLPIGGDFPILCGVGGTVRGISKISNHLNETDTKTITPQLLAEIISHITGDKKPATKTMLKVLPERIHTIIPGGIILESIVEKFGCEAITVSSYGVREGYLYTKLFSDI